MILLISMNPSFARDVGTRFVDLKARALDPSHVSSLQDAEKKVDHMPIAKPPVDNGLFPERPPEKTMGVDPVKFDDPVICKRRGS